MTVQHPHAELSAYVDGALAPAERAAVEGHLDACAVCRIHVAQLRATTALVRALPDPVPSRSLVPRIAVPAWLAPLRTLMTLASGTAVFLFIASSLVSNIAFLAGGSPAGMATRERSGDTAFNAQAPVAAGSAESQDSTAAPEPKALGPVPSPAVAFGTVPTATPAADARGAAGGVATDGVKRAEEVTPAPPAPPAGVVWGEDTRLAAATRPEPSPLVNPWLWLTVAILSGAIAFALHRRLRAPA